LASNVLVWMDLEMTGLDPDTCAIIEMAIIVTDSKLNELAAPLSLVIWQPPSVLDAMIPFVRNMHTKSGLLEKVRQASISVIEAERQAMELIMRHAQYRTAPLCGNSIGQDRRFLSKYMPQLEGYLHYRQIDVSSVKELAERWYNVKYKKPNEGKHTALHDIQQSIAPLKYYRDHVLRAPL